MVSRVVDFPLLLLAVGATVTLGLFIGSQVEVSRCRGQAGRVMRHGLDHACTRADGSTVPIAVLPSTPGPQVAIAVIALATAGAIYVGLLRIVKPRRKPA